MTIRRLFSLDSPWGVFSSLMGLPNESREYYHPAVDGNPRPEIAGDAVRTKQYHLQRTGACQLSLRTETGMSVWTAA